MYKEETTLPFIEFKTKTTINTVYDTYLQCVASDSTLNISTGIKKTVSGILKALVNTPDINVTLPDYYDGVNVIDVVKTYANNNPHKNIIVYTDHCVNVLAMLKGLKNVMPLRYGDLLYERVRYDNFDLVLLLPQRKSEHGFANITTIASDLHMHQQYIQIDKLNIVGLGVNLKQYKEQADEYAASASGKIVIKDEDGHNSIVEIK